MKIRTSEPVAISKFRQAILDESMTTANISSVGLKFKNIELIGHGTNLNYSFGGKKEVINDFCNIQQVFSDKMLARKGKDINWVYNGKTVLTKLASTGTSESFSKMDILIQRGAEINKPDLFGNTALHKVMGPNELRFLKLLVNNNVDVNAVNRKGNTALHQEILATYGKYTGFEQLNNQQKDEIINLSKTKIGLLIENKARIDIQNREGLNVIDFAKKLNVPQVIIETLEGKSH
jgi:ankyrin repeat protein